MPGTPHTDALELAILTLVMDRQPAPVHQDDLARAFAADDWPAAVDGMLVDGLIHREGALYIASRAAVRTAELLG